MTIHNHAEGRGNHMGASRDYTAGARSGTATLTRSDTRTRRPREAAPSPRRIAPHIPHSPGRGRLGSRQVVSVRGRRVGVPTAAKRRFSTVSAVAIPLLVAGIVLAMVLSGASTNQSFTIQQLQTRERALSNEVESLNRDLEDARSSAEIAQRASAAGMVVPGEPGILAVDEAGAVTEQRPADPEASTRVVDVNGTAPGSGRASSDREATSEIGDRLTTVPGGNVLGRDRAAQPAAPNSQGNLAPYAPNVPATTP